MLETQDGHCAICPATPAEVGLLVVDHDHSCCNKGKSCGSCLRLLLCSNCNTGLGLFSDSIERLIRAAEYIKLHKKEVIKIGGD
jgi:hypothetical protein